MKSDVIMKKIKKMSLEEKIGQLNQVQLEDTEQIREEVRKGRVGSVILADTATAGNDEQKRIDVTLLNELQKIAVEQSPTGIPLIFGRDVIHGHSVVLPIPLAGAASFNTELLEKAYRAVAEEAANDGVHWTFSPMIDISRDPRWGRCIEGFGEDPHLTSEMGKAVIRGFQGDDYKNTASIAACAKHYLGYGAVEGGRDYGKTEISDYTLRNYYLRPFKAAVETDVATVMNSFSEISGQPIASSRYLLRDVLKDELGFKGFVISDWASIAKLVNHRVAKDEKEAAMLAANAELDMDMVDKCYIQYLGKLVSEGKVQEKTIDEMVYRVLSVKEKFGLLDHPYTEPKQISYKEHLRLAKQCADEGMVLLKNNNVLPLEKSEKIAVTGPFLYEKRSHLGSWAPDYNPEMLCSIQEAFSGCEEADNIVFAQLSYLWDDVLPMLKNVKTVVLVLGESARMSGENNCVTNIDLPPEQLEFIKKIRALGKKTIGVMCFGRPIALGEAEQYLDAILYAWQSGTCAAQSIVDIVYGRVNPSGRLPMTFPRVTGQIPIYYNYPAFFGGGMSYYGKDDSYLDCPATPMYPFGYGLSYTRFEYSKIECDRSMLTLEELKNGEKFKVYAVVTNTGEHEGKEVSQCYISDLVASMTRPIKELKGFSKNLLKPGESKELMFLLGFEELGFYNRKGEFCVEKGEFDIFIGNDCTTTNKISLTVV